jgi:hypothetical protein
MVNVVALETVMSAREVLSRLACQGFWLDPNQPQAAAWIRQYARRANVSFDQAAQRLSRDPAVVAAAIRRQWFANVLWYARPVAAVLYHCMRADPAATLLDVLDLHEHDSRPTVPVELASKALADSVVLDGDQPIGAGGNDIAGRTRSPSPRSFDLPSPRRVDIGAERESLSPVVRRLWPRMDAPDYVPAGTRFEVTVGFGRETQRGVVGADIILEVPAGVEQIPLTVVLIASGLDADRWSAQLLVDVDNPTAAEVRFTLVGRMPVGTEPVHLTTIEARYVRDGAVIGSASRPIVIGLPTMATLNTPEGRGMPWLAQPAAATAVDVRPGLAADLTIELAKPDHNAATGIYSCRLYSPHHLSVSSGPYDVDLGQDAKTFARMVVDQVRQYNTHDIVDNLLRSFGDLVAEQLPPEVMDAVTEVGRLVAPNPPSVLILSADPYVPWELARMPTPIDPARPAYLGAQVLLGRWLQDVQPRTRTDANPRPPVQPPGELSVRHMAVMVGMYSAASGLRALPAAQQEAQTIAAAYGTVPLDASQSSLKQLLDANVEDQFKQIGGVDAVHFAGHGDFDPTRPDSSVLFLSDGLPLSSILFRSAKYGGPQQPLLFLNACMIGIGGQLLGDMGGFPGNCLKGGFGGVLGALWEVDDAAAAAIAIEFWKRAMPSGGNAGEPIGAILRDLRGRYMTGRASPPETTYLAYVYYGHPSLTLR